MSEQKDCWDKAEIVGKIVGAVAIPVVAVCIAWVWNVQQTRQQTAAAMTEIAIGVLSTRPDENQPGALREWAISVLLNPSNPPVLTEQAADQLRLEPIMSLYGQTLENIMKRTPE